MHMTRVTFHMNICSGLCRIVSWHLHQQGWEEHSRAIGNTASQEHLISPWLFSYCKRGTCTVSVLKYFYNSMDAAPEDQM